MYYNNYQNQTEEKMNYYVNEKFVKSNINVSEKVCYKCGCYPCRCTLYMSASIEYSDYYFCPYCGKYLIEEGGCNYCVAIRKSYYNNSNQCNNNYGRATLQNNSTYNQSCYGYGYNVCPPYYNPAPPPYNPVPPYNPIPPYNPVPPYKPVPPCNSGGNNSCNCGRCCQCCKCKVKKQRPNLGEPCGCVKKTTIKETFDSFNFNYFYQF
ncbi:MAG: hypothetical protein ATN31_06590 [Candidatus Epulonipiscioides saccharophilum]|nr:MAG: hypothetical protein ATN31_06590 [Epulopiscium sp. AS2M-Bin001]